MEKRKELTRLALTDSQELLEIDNAKSLGVDTPTKYIKCHLFS
jgi:hypothetical protein